MTHAINKNEQRRGVALSRLFLITALLIGNLIADEGPGQATFDNALQNRLQSHVRFLASDLLEGRETSYRGQKLAALYIANQFMISQLESPRVAYHQQSFDVFVSEVDEAASFMNVSGPGGAFELSFPNDVYIYPRFARDLRVNQKMVFMGYGISKPGNGYDDYASHTAKGRWAVIFAGAPADVSWEPIRLYQKMRWARKAEALGLIVLVDDDQPQAALATGGPPPRRMGFERLQERRSGLPVLLINESQWPSVLGKSLQPVMDARTAIDRDGIPHSFPIRRKADVRIKTRTGQRRAENVLGLVGGNDPELKNEIVVVSAHYDHLGVIAGHVFNGADDNAGGTALIIEMAREFAIHPPRRSVLFLAVSGEEVGLLGSRYFLDHPPVPIENIVCDINVDMVARNNGRQIGIIPAHEDQSTLLEMLDTVNIKHRFEFLEKFDQYHHRSDHYNFIKKGIPALFFFSGIHDDYHSITDDWQTLDYDKLARVYRLISDFVLEVANASQKPAFVNPLPESTR